VAPLAPIGGLFSVALSCGSPRLAVSQHPALRSPDLPQPAAAGRDHPAGSLTAMVPSDGASTGLPTGAL